MKKSSVPAVAMSILSGESNNLWYKKNTCNLLMALKKNGFKVTFEFQNFSLPFPAHTITFFSGAACTIVFTKL
jgi:hypothetical protein